MNDSTIVNTELIKCSDPSCEQCSWYYRQPFLFITVDKRAEGGYTVAFPHLPGCVSQGNTLEEAVVNGRHACAKFVKEKETLDETTKEKV
jgi:predicted RNase H-like HicB family nuclease